MYTDARGRRQQFTAVSVRRHVGAERCGKKSGSVYVDKREDARGVVLVGGNPREVGARRRDVVDLIARRNLRQLTHFLSDLLLCYPSQHVMLLV